MIYIKVTTQPFSRHKENTMFKLNPKALVEVNQFYKECEMEYMFYFY